MFLPIVILAAVLVVVLLILVKKKSSEEKDEPPRPDKPPTPENRRNIEKTFIREHESRGGSLTILIDELYKEFPDAESVALKKVTYEDRKMIGVFLIERSDSLLKHREIEHRFLTRTEIKEKGEIGSIGSISDIEKERLYKGSVEFLVDEYKNIYLKSGDKIKNISPEKVKREDMISQGREWVSSTQNIDLDRLKIKNISSDEQVLVLLLDEKGSDEDHYLVIEEGVGVLEYKKTSSQVFSDEKEKSELTHLEFTHGIEVELQVIKDDWSWVDGNQMTIVFEEILNGAGEKLARLRDEASPLIQSKWTGKIETDEDDKGYEAVHIGYSCLGEEKRYSIFGKDSHVALKTNILEIKTPPCEYLEELEWWIHNLYRIAHEVVEELDIGATVLSIGTNPVEEYSEGVSFGEHHHIGFENEELKKETYNLFRYFIPHLIGISSNSPFHGGKFPDHTYNDLDNLVLTENSYSMRLKKNNEQFKVPPYLPLDKDKSYFEETLGRVDEPLRMIDIFPFTRFGTIEVRIFDTQITTLDRISIAVVLQAMAMYVKDNMDGSEGNASISDSVLKKNRKEAVENGLLGRFYGEETEEDLYPIIEKSRKDYLYESWREVMAELWPYLEDMGVSESVYLKNLILRLYDEEDVALQPPIAPAQLILYRQEDDDKELEDVLEKIRAMGLRAASDPGYHLWSEDIELEEVSCSEIDP